MQVEVPADQRGGLSAVWNNPVRFQKCNPLCYINAVLDRTKFLGRNPTWNCVFGPAADSKGLALCKEASKAGRTRTIVHLP